ncbi:hypothetical protein ACT4VC_09430 [Acinetobacter baumannii]
MKIEKIDYARKLIKFDKTVEASKVLENILHESDDKFLVSNAIELLLTEIEFKQPTINSVKVLNLISQFKKNGGDEAKIQIFEKKVKDKSIQKAETILEFSNSFKENYYFFEQNFLNVNFDQKVNQKKFEIIDLDLAKIIAHDQDIEEPYESWNDLRADISKQIYSFIFKEKIKLDLFENEINKLNKSLEKKSEDGRKVFYYFLDDLEADIHLILMANYIGFKNKLIDMLLEAYQINYMPCGWKGEFPSGNLCVTNGMLEFEIN